MKNRNLGRTSLSVAPFGLGGNVFGWTASEAESFRVLDAFVDYGFNLVDTADIYSVWAPGNKGGESETVIGRWLKKSGKRNKVIIATKVGMELTPEKKGLSRKHILRSADESLTRLGIECIDLYQAHQDDPETPLEETLSAFGELVKAGKVKALGASNYSGARLQKALEVSRKNGLPRYETLQPRYNLIDRENTESDLIPVCQQEGLSIINFYSLAAGFLSGKYRAASDKEKSQRGSGVMSKYFHPRGLKVLAAMDKVRERTGATHVQIAMAWLLEQPAVAAPLASATNLSQLEEIVSGTKLKLDQESLAELNQASAWN